MELEHNAEELQEILISEWNNARNCEQNYLSRTIVTENEICNSNLRTIATCN